MSRDRREDGLSFDIKLHTEKRLYQKQLYQKAPQTKISLSSNFLGFLDKIHFVLSELAQYYSRYQPKCKNSI